jgi:glutathionylspermidine synthase
VNDSPWLAAQPVPADEYPALRRRAIFEGYKWDPQVGDVSTIASAPLLITASAWQEVADLAKALAAELAAAERELLARPDLHRRLGLPRAVRRALRRAGRPTCGAARLIRFDFHYTAEGWRISEANADVPGGLNEASAFPPLFARWTPEARPTGDPTAAYARAIAAAIPAGGRVALVYATAFTDDQQVMSYLAARLESLGVEAVLASPAHLRWERGHARLDAAWAQGEVHAVVRFFPAEWLPRLARRCGWECFFRGGRTPVSNPAWTILGQTKRLPLAWDRLAALLPTWRRLLPETRDPRAADASGEWVLKPALGRVGEGVAMAGVTSAAEMRSIRRSARWFPGHWIAQRRFQTLPLPTPGGAVYPCLGVYTVDGVVVGAYGRVAAGPLVDGSAQDAAVLVCGSEQRHIWEVA